MHNALHAKDGSEQNNKHQSHHAKCIAFNVSEEKLRKDEVSPSLEQQTKNSFKVSIIPLQNKETAELSQNVNKQKQLNYIRRYTVLRARMLKIHIPAV